MQPQTLWPAEWAPQQAVMLTWPHEHSDWAAQLAATEAVYKKIVGVICRYEEAVVVCYDHRHAEHVRRCLADVTPARFTLHCLPANDTWARDYGPLTVYRDGQRVLTDYRFNGWGGKYPAALDDTLTARLHEAGAFGGGSLRRREIILEGGGVESDGAGTLLATRACLMSRNAGLSQADLEAELTASLGIRHFLWLDHGALEGDDTDGHIDTLARFCDARTIAYVDCDDPDDPHYPALAAMRAQLASFRDPAGNPYRLLPLPWPQAVYEDGQRLPLTYAYFLIINQAVLVPLYGDPADAHALAVLAEAFPHRQMVGIDCLPLVYQYGSLHCATMQIPHPLSF